MTIKRRSPGQRRRRLRRADELEQVEALFPELIPELLELRKYNPQAYRKRLVGLTRKGRISRGRGYNVPDEIVAWLDQDLAEIITSVEGALSREELDFRAVQALFEEERSAKARPDVLAWLRERHERVLDDENRHVP